MYYKESKFIDCQWAVVNRIKKIDAQFRICKGNGFHQIGNIFMNKNEVTKTKCYVTKTSLRVMSPRAWVLDKNGGIR